MTLKENISQSVTQGCINMCIASDLGLCNLNQALYPMEILDWCIYALFKQNEAKIEEHCKYKFSSTNKNYAETLEGFVWAIAAIQTQKPFVIALIIGTVIVVALLIVGCAQMWKHKGTLDLVRNMSKEAGQLVDKENPLSFFKRFRPPIHQANEQNIEKFTAEILGASCSASVNEMRPLCTKATAPLTPPATIKYEQEVVPMQTGTGHTTNSNPGRL